MNANFEKPIRKGQGKGAFDATGSSEDILKGMHSYLPKPTLTGVFSLLSATSSATKTLPTML